MKYRITFAFAVFILFLMTSLAFAQSVGLTSHEMMVNRLRDIAASGSGRIKVISVGQSVQGRDILLVVLRDPKVAVDRTKKLFVICRQHGDEPATTEGMLRLMDDLNTDPDSAAAELLSKVTIFIVPMVNPDGADAFKRSNANDVDLNRDWLALSQPETRAVRAMVDAVKPDVILDEHELSPGNNRSDYIETGDASSGASGGVVAKSEYLESLVIGQLRVHDMIVRAAHIREECPTRLAHRYFPICAGIPSLLFESGQSGVRRDQLQYRMDLHVIATMTVAQYLAGREGTLGHYCKKQH